LVASLRSFQRLAQRATPPIGGKVKNWKMWATVATVAVTAWGGSAVVSWFTDSKLLSFGSLVAFAVAFSYLLRVILDLPRPRSGTR